MLELKIPPPVVTLVLALLMWLTPAVAGLVQVPYSVRLLCSIALVCIGQSIGTAGMVAFRRAKTTVNPVKANMASSLVIGGLYRYTRNPMYVGLLLTLSTWACRLRCSSSTRASSVASLQIALSGTRLADCSCLQRQRGQRRRLG